MHIDGNDDEICKFVNEKEMEKYKKIIENLIKKTKPLLPVNSIYDTESKTMENYKIAFWWNTDDDKEKPNKQKRIVIVLLEELLSDVYNAPEI